MAPISCIPYILISFCYSFCVFSFFCTEKGKVLKVLHAIEGAFIIAQYSLFHDDSPIINMAIDSKKVAHIFNKLIHFKTGQF